jgi:hypothetical protein
MAMLMDTNEVIHPADHNLIALQHLYVLGLPLSLSAPPQSHLKAVCNRKRCAFLREVSLAAQITIRGEIRDMSTQGARRGSVSRSFVFDILVFQRLSSYACQARCLA